MRGKSRLGRTVRNRGNTEMKWCGKWIGVRNTLLLLDKRSDYQSEMIVRMDMFMNNSKACSYIMTIDYGCIHW